MNATKPLILLGLVGSLTACGFFYTSPDCVKKSKDPVEASYECLPGVFNTRRSYSSVYAYGPSYSGSNPYGTPSPSLYVQPGPGTRITTYGGNDMWSSSQYNKETGRTTNCYGAYGSVSCY